MKITSRIVSIFAVFALLALAQTLPTGVEKRASMGGITEYDYPNGLKVLLYPDAANPEVTINVTYLVGSRHEGSGETGMAHLLEHLDFITETTNGRQIKNETMRLTRRIGMGRRRTIAPTITRRFRPLTTI